MCPFAAARWRQVLPSGIWLFGLEPSFKNFNNCSEEVRLCYNVRMRNRILPVSPFSAVRKRMTSEWDDRDDDDDDDVAVVVDDNDVDVEDDVGFKSLLSVYNGISAMSFGDVKRFSATKIERNKGIFNEDRRKSQWLSQADTISMISICIRSTRGWDQKHKKARW